MKNEKLTEEEIKVELRKLEQKEGLKNLDADVVSKTEEWHTFMLKAKAGKSKKQTKIQRKPTKATNEEEVSEADRQLHQKIAVEVKAKLEAKGESSEGVETFEAFYGMLKEEAAKLQKEYQPQLRDGIKIAVDLVNSVKEDEQDGDVDVKVKIAPNTVEDEVNLKWEKGTEENSILTYPGVQICSNANLAMIQRTKDEKKKKVRVPNPKIALEKIGAKRKIGGNVKNITYEHVVSRKKALEELLEIRKIERDRCFKHENDVDFSCVDEKIKKAYETHKTEIKATKTAISNCDEFLDLVDSMSDVDKEKMFPKFVNNKWT